MWQCAKVAGGFAGRTAHALSSPADVTVAKDGDYIVSDRRNNRVQKCPHTDKGDIDLFTKEGKRKASRRRVICYTIAGGSYGSGNKQMKSPRGVTVDKDGYIVIADSKNHRILKCKDIKKGGSVDCYTAVGGKKGTGKDQLNEPWGVAVTADGSYVVADSKNHRIQKCSPGTPGKPGTCFTLIGAKGKGKGDDQFYRPLAVAIR